MSVLLVFVGGMLGAPLRYLIDQAVQARRAEPFPWGTLLVNLLGCVVLGALTGAGSALPEPVYAFAATGFCGALTTYSTFSYETLRLVERRAYFEAVLNVLLSVAAGLGVALLAHTLTAALLS